MKKINLFLLLTLFSLGSNAQIVNIPDPVFKNYLVSALCTSFSAITFAPSDDVDTNNDGEIQVSEALAVTVLHISGVDNIDLTGIAAFSNLKFVYMNEVVNLAVDLSGNPSVEWIEMHTGTFTAFNLSGLANLKMFNTAFCHFPVIDFSSLTGLETFSIWQGSIPALELSNLPILKDVIVAGPEFQDNNIMQTVTLHNLPGIEKLHCEYLGLTSLDVSDLVTLKELSCYQNQLSSLDVSNLTQLSTLECGKNNLASVDISNLTELESYGCRENLMTSLELPNLPSLHYLYCDNNQMTTLNLSNVPNMEHLSCGFNQLTSLDVSNLTHLHWINARNNLFTMLDLSYSTHAYWNNLNFSDNPNLTYINIKTGGYFNFHTGEGFKAVNCPNLEYICANEFNFSQINVPQAQVSSYCSFTPGGNFNTISGTLTFDLNNDGCDAGDALSLNSKMKISSEFSSGVAFANAAGNYTFFTQAGNFTVTPDFENPYFTVSPASAIVNFETDDNLNQTADFCITPNGIHNDVEIILVSSQGPRPGFDAHYRLIYKNKGNQVLSGNINFTFDDAVLDLAWTSPMLAGQTLNNLNWDYENLLPFETRYIDVVLNVNSPQETPPVNLGDILNFTATINPVSGDDTPADNTFALAQTVAGSYDPNDKMCLEGDWIDPEKIGDYLHYVVRFQNSGTAVAENIVVKDDIDSEKFDMNSLQIVGSSHPHTTRVSGNKVEFIFEGILLPAEQDDEPWSHGFVAFKIKTKNTLTTGDSVSNKADIFFDYNFPITTNTATSVFQLLARDQFEDASVSLHPNPVKNALTITANDNIKSIQLYDVMGRLIETGLQNSNTVQFDVSKQASGIYFVKIATEKGTKTEKIIKE